MAGAAGAGAGGLSAMELATLVPRLAYELAHTGAPHAEIEGSLLSADISGFTRLTEALTSHGREGAEIITSVVNSCFDDLIAVAVERGGDVIKFGGDAVLVLFRGPSHQRRAAQAGTEMQHALARNTHARRNDLHMTVGVADGVFHAIVAGRSPRDLLLCGDTTSETLRLEAAAAHGEVLVTPTIAAHLVQRQHSGGVVVHDAPTLEVDDVEGPAQLMAEFVPGKLIARYRRYVDLGAEHRQAAIGFVAIGGVDDRIAAVGAPAAAEEMRQLVDAVHDIADTTDTTVLHSDMAIDGFKLLLAAGLPDAIAAPGDALVHAALAIRTIDTPFTIRIGLNIGTGFVGFLGSPRRRTFTVMGDVVNTAARLLLPAEAGDIVAAAVVTDRTRAAVEGTPLEPFTVKGKQEPLHALRVDALDRNQSPTEHRVPFTGRDPELSRLVDSLGTQDAVVVTGAPGSGKSRLREEALAAEALDDDQVFQGAGGQYLAANPYGAFWAPARRLLGIDPDAPPDAAATELVETLRADRPDLLDRAALLAPIFQADIEDSVEVAALDDAFRQNAAHETFASLLGGRQPDVRAILVEDAQWLDDASRLLTEHLESVSRDHNWVVVRFLRSETSATNEGARAEPTDETEDAESGPAAPGADVQIALGPLPDHAIAAIIETATTRLLLESEIETLVRRSRGSPLFALELAATIDAGHGRLPDTIEEVIAERIDRLDPRARATVQLASVLGARFERSTFGALAEAAGIDGSLEHPSLESIVVEDDGHFAFREPLYREVAYAMLPFAHRKRLHRRVGDHLEATAEDTSTIAGLLSEHFHAANDRRRCWRYSITAAERAAEQYSPVDAARLYRRALDAAPRGLSAVERATARAGLGTALMSVESLEDAFHEFSRARRLTADPMVRLHLRLQQASCRNQQGRYPDALRLFREITRDATAAATIAASLVGESSVLYRQGRNRDSLDVATRARDVAGTDGLDRLLGRAYQQMGAAAEALGDERCTDFLEQALNAFRRVDDQSGQAEVTNNLGVIAQLEGRLADAAQLYRESHELKSSVGDRLGAALVSMNLAEVELDRGSLDGVAELLDRSAARFERAGFAVGSAYVRGLRGRFELADGRPQSAVGLLHGARSAFDDLGAPGYVAEMDLYLLDALPAAGSTEEALIVLDRCRETLANQIFDNPQSAARKIEAAVAVLDLRE